MWSKFVGCKSSSRTRKRAPNPWLSSYDRSAPGQAAGIPHGLIGRHECDHFSPHERTVHDAIRAAQVLVVCACPVKSVTLMEW